MIDRKPALRPVARDGVGGPKYASPLPDPPPPKWGEGSASFA